MKEKLQEEDLEDFLEKLFALSALTTENKRKDTLEAIRICIRDLAKYDKFIYFYYIIKHSSFFLLH